MIGLWREVILMKVDMDIFDEKINDINSMMENYCDNQCMTNCCEECLITVVLASVNSIKRDCFYE